MSFQAALKVQDKPLAAAQARFHLTTNQWGLPVFTKTIGIIILDLLPREQALQVYGSLSVLSGSAHARTLAHTHFQMISHPSYD